MKNLRITLLLGLSGAVVVGAAAWGAVAVYDTALTSGHTDAITLFDPRDDLEVAGSADNVFHGTVVAKTGEESSDHLPSEVYRVEVGETFKGHLAGTVMVLQVIGDVPSLTPGERYVFTTAPSGDGRVHAVLMEVVLHRAPDLAAAPPADRPAAARDTRTVRDYWRWVVSHQVDVHTLPPEA